MNTELRNRRKLSRLIRNVRSGDRWVLRDETGDRPRSLVCEATRDARECRAAWFTGRRQWEVHYRIAGSSDSRPYFHTGPLTAYSTDRLDVYR